MNNFSWSKALGFGVVIWAAMAVTLWVLGIIPSFSPLWAHGIVAVIGAIIASLFSQNIKAEGGMKALSYGVVWAVIVLSLDFAVTQWFDAHVFASWQYWVGAALVFLSPWVQTETHQVLNPSHQL